MISDWRERQFYKGVGKALKIARKRAGLKQQDLADVLGLARTSVTNMERGNQVISLYHAALIAEVLPEWAGGLDKHAAEPGVVCPHLKADYDYICTRCGELVLAAFAA